MPSRTQDVGRAIARLKSFHDELGMLDVVACGEQAIPALRSLLFERERSGLYQTRCRAVEALSALRAHDVLIEFLEAERRIMDPIERVGEDAVINAAALALANVRERRVLELLLRLARRPALTGVIGALGAFETVEAVPALIGALEEDASRITAENALRRLGEQARAALIRTVTVRAPTATSESESSARRRRSALKLLAEMDGSQVVWRELRYLTRDSDVKLAVRACEIGLICAPASEQRGIVERLIELVGRADWMLQEEIEACLVEHSESTRGIVTCYLNEVPGPGENEAARTQTKTILRHVIARTEPHAVKTS
jgi:HEAT repeat protein